jgi:hypothetical protein
MAKTGAGLGLVLLCLLAGGCASIRLAPGSQGPAYTGPAVTAILVTATAADENVRRSIETAVVARLEASGVRALAEHDVASPGAPADGARLETLARRLGADSVLTVRLAASTRIDPPAVKVTVVPAVTYWGSPRAAGRPPQASYTRTDAHPVEEARLTATLRTVREQQVIWSASTEPFEAKGTQGAVGAFADLVVRALRQQMLIA